MHTSPNDEFVIDKNKKVKKSYVVFYGHSKKCDTKVDGFPILNNEEDSNICAKKEGRGITERFFIKMDPLGVMLDPNNKTELGKVNNRINGANFYELRQVSAPKFNNYIQYLKTNNQMFLTNARKEL